MPVEREVTYTCDAPRCKRRGRRWIIDRGRPAVQVLLCDTHDKPLRDISEWGTDWEPMPGQKGVSRARLERLRVDKPL